MTFRNLTSLIKDLFQVLPSRSKSEWQSLSKIDSSKATIVLISGFAATNRNLSVVRKRLVRDGFNVIVLSMDWQTLSDGVRGLYRMAEILSSTVLQLRKGPCRGKSKIYLVAHSAGGLVARYYVQLLGGSHYCDGLVTLATPHQGTWMAALGLLCHLILKARILLQMLPISPFIEKINTASLPSGFRFTSIWSADDFICPRRATDLPRELWNHSEIENIEVPGLSHGDFLVSKESYRVLLDYLHRGEPRPSRRTESQPMKSDLA